MRIFFQNLIYLVEFLLLKIIFFLLNIFPISFVSKFGGILFMTFGQLTNSHKTAIKNCKQVFQNMENKKIKKIVLKSWENLGRTIFELIKLKIKYLLYILESINQIGKFVFPYLIKWISKWVLFIDILIML